MPYTIVSVDETRHEYKESIRQLLDNYMTEYQIAAVDGRDPEQLRFAQLHRPVDFKTGGWNAGVGHAGVWHSMLNAIEHAPVLTIEDDAVLVARDWWVKFMAIMSHMPYDTDFISFYIPEHDKYLHKPSMNVNNHLSRPYQTTGGVMWFFTAQGSRNILELVRLEGASMQFDQQLYRWESEGKLTGYTPQPWVPRLVDIADVPSIAQWTDSYA